MISHPKVNTILEELWNGKEKFKCNGDFKDFSVLISRLFDNVDDTNISFTYDCDGRKVISNDIGFWDIVYKSFTKP
jgi:hypothetical protein